MAPDKMSQLFYREQFMGYESSYDVYRTKSSAILSDYAHILCAHQPIQQNFPVRSKSYSVFHIPMSCSF